MRAPSLSGDAAMGGGDRRRASRMRRLVRALANAIECLFPRARAGREAELPPEWFKYPPF